MGEVAPFPWTRLVIFEPYSGQASFDRRLGFPWRYKVPNIEYLDDRNFLVLVNGDSVVAAFDLIYSVADISAPFGEVERNASRFLVERSQNWRHLRPFDPVFEFDVWPGEGIPIIESQSDTLVVYPLPRLGLAPVGRVSMKRGTRIRYDSTRYQTITPAPFAPSDSTIRGHSYGLTRHVTREQYYNGGRDTVVRAGRQRLWLLQFRAEGECFISVNSLVLTAPCPPVGKMVGAREPHVAWWAWTPGPKVQGWFIVSDSTARVVARQF